jgi:probable F420-dependent oxidoreductase
LAEFGVVVRDPVRVAYHARRIEAIGYDIVACGEHIAFHVPTPSAFVSLSVAAGATQQVRLMSTIVALPLYPAVLAAKMGAALDVASGGRFTMGVGIGGEYPAEYEACGVPLSERGARCDEALEVIRRCWTERDVSYSGRFNRFRGVTIEPAPVQAPHPPLWVAGRRAAAMRRAASVEGWLPYMYTPEMLRESVDTIRSLRERAELDPDAIRVGLFISAVCHSDGDVARRYATERLSKHYAQDFQRRIGRYSLAGTPSECSDRLQRYLDSGADTIIVASACPDHYVEENEQRLFEDVVSPLRGSSEVAR